VILVYWICGSGSKRAKMTHKNREKERNFMFLSSVPDPHPDPYVF
jgi:hypothetical protein